MAVVVPVGVGMLHEALDTIQSVRHFLPNSQLVIADDKTDDGTYERLQELAAATPSIALIRNSKRRGRSLLSVTLGDAFKWALHNLDFDVLLRLDVDALVTGPGLDADAVQFARTNPAVGIFGRHLMNADGSVKSYAMHTNSIRRRLAMPVPRPWWYGTLQSALAQGWGLGENVFGGACFYSRSGIEALDRTGALSQPEHRGSDALIEDVYFTMATVAAGLDRGHFAQPTAPCALAWHGLPYAASDVLARGDKLVHSVDKGPHTEGAREAFRAARCAVT